MDCHFLLQGIFLTQGSNPGLLDFLEVRQVLSTYDGPLRDPLWWPQERTVHMGQKQDRMARMM